MYHKSVVAFMYHKSEVGFIHHKSVVAFMYLKSMVGFTCSENVYFLYCQVSHKVLCLKDLTHMADLKASSRQAMIGSLTGKLGESLPGE